MIPPSSNPIILFLPIIVLHAVHVRLIRDRKEHFRQINREGLFQIFKDAKDAVEGLETEEERSRVYADFVERLEKFAKQKGKFMMSVMGTMKIMKKDFFIHGKEYILSRLN